LQQK